MDGGSESIRVLFAVLITIAAVFDDMKRYKISNRIVGVGFVVAVAVNVFELFTTGKVVAYFSGGLVAFVIMLIAYAVMAVGAGDVKLAGVLGMFLGLDMICKVLVLAFLYTGLLGTLVFLMGHSREIKLAIGKVHTIHYSLALLFGEVCGLMTMYAEVWI
ncbi:MAG: prepilin peptidase [Lachnospira sp.]|nr:prepilin peptidase [Lachnospira sp.]